MELQTTGETVAGVDGPVAVGLTLGKCVPDGATGHGWGRRGGGAGGWGGGRGHLGATLNGGGGGGGEHNLAEDHVLRLDTVDGDDLAGDLLGARGALGGHGLGALVGLRIVHVGHGCGDVDGFGDLGGLHPVDDDLGVGGDPVVGIQVEAVILIDGDAATLQHLADGACGDGGVHHAATVVDGDDLRLGHLQLETGLRDGGVRVGVDGIGRADLIQLAEEVFNADSGGGEGLFPTVDHEGDLLGGAHGDHGLTGQGGIRGRGDEILRAQLHAGLLQGTLDRSREGGQRDLLAIDVDDDVLLGGGDGDPTDEQGGEHTASGQTQGHGPGAVELVDPGFLMNRHVNALLLRSRGDEHLVTIR